MLDRGEDELTHVTIVNSRTDEVLELVRKTATGLINDATYYAAPTRSSHGLLVRSRGHQSEEKFEDFAKESRDALS
jgi:hypothetical protein